MSDCKEFTGSRRLRVGDDPALIKAAMDEAEGFIKDLALDPKSALRIRLLTEEVLEMVKTMVGTFSGDFWVEHSKDEFHIHLDGKTQNLDLNKENELLSASKDGENISIRGFGAKISHFITHYDEYINNLLDAMGESVTNDYMYLGPITDNATASQIQWTMQNYANYVTDGSNEGENIEADRDELEKSILANLADDIQVGVLDDNITITVIKKI